MSRLFPRYINLLPLFLLIAGGAGATGALGAVWYYFSPRYTDVGYQPEQPVPYSHAFHVGQLGLDCRYCHTGVENNRKALVPSGDICMNCHMSVRPSGVSAKRIEPVIEGYNTETPVEWIRIHDLPDYVMFSHQAHINVGVGCDSCHGPVHQMEVVYQHESLSMGWCLDCHRNPEKHIRPVDQVTNLDYVNQKSPKERREIALELIEAHDIQPPENCSACHY